ncbi:MAG: hypothetical protein NVSMB57_06290 [Actinomycetota bacterium]
MGVKVRAESESGIGSILRDARQSRGHSVEEIAWRLRIRPDVLRSLEDDSYESIGHTAFVRTHLRSYAKALGLDAAEVVRRYRRIHEHEVSSPIAALDEAEKIGRKHVPRSRWFLAAAVAAAFFLVASMLGILGGKSSTSVASRPPVFPVGPRIQFEPASRALAPARTEQVVVRIASVKATTLTIVVDGKRSFSGTLAPGASRLFTGINSIDLAVDDVSALQVWATDVRVTPAVRGAWHGTFGRAGLVP